MTTRKHDAHPMRNSHAVLLLCAAGLAACGEESVAGRGEAFDRGTSALSGSNAVLAIVGTYGSACTARTGAWSIALNGYVLGTTETALTVVQNDADCVLSITTIKGGTVATPVVYGVAVPFVLGAGFATTGVPFLLGGTGGTQFYANFSISPDVTFAANFVVQMVYSDNVSETDLTTNGKYVVQTSSATAALVPAPNGTMSLASLSFNVDAHKVVKSANGNAVMTQGTVVGEFYVIENTLTASPTYAAVDAAYMKSTNERLTMTTTPQSISTGALKLVGLDLTTPKQVNVIVANIVNGVNSYQVFEITFNKP